MLENVKMESSAHLYIKNKQKTPKLKQSLCITVQFTYQE